MLTSREPGRSVAHLPELLSASYRNRVRNLSPRNRNQGVHDQPESHIVGLGPIRLQLVPTSFLSLSESSL
jgi:hypothetical protein